MAYRAKVLQIKAEKFEVKNLQGKKVTKERVAALEPLLQDIYTDRRPKPADYSVRRDLVRVFNEMAKEIYGNSKDIPVVVEFGSFVMDLFAPTSDLDLSVNFNSSDVAFPREKKIQTLRKFAKKLYAIQSKGHVSGVLPITTAKVPILKCIDRGTGVECDISVENKDGILKSKLIHIISSIDERFQKLCFLMKTWAKAHNINSSKDKTLNSLSIILLVALHLQTRSPPIIPPFSSIFKDGTDPIIVKKSLANYVNYGKRNGESLAELFVTLLIKLSSVEKLWPKGLCASAYDASWTSKTWDSSKVACISVEDFTDRSQNVARAVGVAEVKKIYKCIELSIQQVFSFLDGKIGRVQLRDFLFGQDGIGTPIPRNNANLHPIAALPSISQAGRHVTGKRKKQVAAFSSATSVSAKRFRIAEGWREMPNGNDRIAQVEDWVGPRSSTSFQPVDLQRPVGGWSEAYTGGWGVSQQPSLGGWEGSWEAGVGGFSESCNPISKGWRGTQQPSAGSWGVSVQPSWGGWERSQEPSGVGWGGLHNPISKGWGGTQQPSAGGWGGTQQPSAGGWGGSPNPVWTTLQSNRRF